MPNSVEEKGKKERPYECVPVKPDGKLAWTVVVASFVSTDCCHNLTEDKRAIAHFRWSIWSLMVFSMRLVPSRKTWSHISMLRNGPYHWSSRSLAVSIFSVVRIFHQEFVVYRCISSAPVASKLCDKFGCGIVGIIGSLLASSAIAISVFSPNIYCMWILFGVFGGIGMGLVYLPSILIVGYCFEDKRAIATGLSFSIHMYGVKMDLHIFLF